MDFTGFVCRFGDWLLPQYPQSCHQRCSFAPWPLREASSWKVVHVFGHCPNSRTPMSNRHCVTLLRTPFFLLMDAMTIETRTQSLHSSSIKYMHLIYTVLRFVKGCHCLLVFLTLPTWAKTAQIIQASVLPPPLKQKTAHLDRGLSY